MSAIGDDFALVFAGDDRCAMGIAVAMYSALLYLAPAASPTVCVLESDLSDRSRDRIREAARRARPATRIHWVPTPPERLGRVPDGSHVTPAAYARLLIPDLVPRPVRRAVYLDADVLVRGDLSPLFTVDLRGAPLGAVQDFRIPTTNHEASGIRERTQSRPYFNSGVLVLDVAQWRSAALADCVLEYAAAGDALRWPDQDAMNAVLVGWRQLDARWNVQPRSVEARLVGLARPRVSPLLMEKELQQQHGHPTRAAFIVHFVGGVKPWHARCVTPGSNEWVRRLLQAGWYRPRQAALWLLRRYLTRTRYRLAAGKRELWDRVRRPGTDVPSGSAGSAPPA